MKVVYTFIIGIVCTFIIKMSDENKLCIETSECNPEGRSLKQSLILLSRIVIFINVIIRGACMQTYCSYILNYNLLGLCQSSVIRPYS